jgi:hypothetical protein
MAPALLDGDVVVVAPAAPAGLRVGDVVCWEEPPGRLFLHRVVGRAGGDLIAKGDALAYLDMVPAAAVLGRAVARERGGRARRLDGDRGTRAGRMLAALSVACPTLLRLAGGARTAGQRLLGG